MSTCAIFRHSTHSRRSISRKRALQLYPSQQRKCVTFLDGRRKKYGFADFVVPSSLKRLISLSTFSDEIPLLDMVERDEAFVSSTSISCKRPSSEFRVPCIAYSQCAVCSPSHRQAGHARAIGVIEPIARHELSCFALKTISFGETEAASTIKKGQVNQVD